MCGSVVEFGDLVSRSIQIFRSLDRQEAVFCSGSLDLDEVAIEEAGQLADEAFDLHGRLVFDGLLDEVPTEVEFSVQSRCGEGEGVGIEDIDDVGVEVLGVTDLFDEL